MANLRANNLCGPDGRNAIDGSLYFQGYSDGVASDYLKIPDSDDLDMGTGDFTFECWTQSVETPGTGGDRAMGIFSSGAFTAGGLLIQNKNNGPLRVVIPLAAGGNFDESGSTNLWYGNWHHIAVVKTSNTIKAFINGVQEISATHSVGVDFAHGGYATVGENCYVTYPGDYPYRGYISNLRLIKGTALYTANFTPPTEKLIAIDGTVLLCCQDSDDPTQEATGKTITGYGTLGGDKGTGNLITNALDWGGASSSQSTTMPYNWTAGNGAEVQYTTGGTSGGGANRMLRLYNDGSNSYIYQTIPTVIGQKYQIDLWYEAENSSLAVKWLAGTSAADATDGYSQWNVGSNGDQATRTGTFIASATTTYFTFQIISGTDGASVFVDDIQVRAVNPKTPKVLPPGGIDEGVVFDGDIKMNSQSYMYFPTGDTSQRGRGRGVVFAGENPSKNKSISYVQMQSGGIAKDFGDLTKDCGETKAVGSSTRGVVQLSGDNPATRDTLEYITFATTSNSIDFGDLNVAWWMRAAAGNQTRGIFAGGLYPGSAMKDDIDYITIASTGDATDFGNLTEAKNAAGGLASSTRMIIGGGQSPASNPNTTNTIEYITIASTGNGTNFGDLTVIGKEVAAVASSTRGVFGPRRSNPAVVNTIDYITIATLGDAVDFGDGSTARGGAASLSNSTRGAWAGGYTPSLTNSMEYVDIATTGDAKDFGDLTYNSQYCGGCSDSHGGLS